MRGYNDKSWRCALVGFLLFLFVCFLIWGKNVLCHADRLPFMYYCVLLAQIGRNPGLQAIWEDEKQRRREKCESSQIKTPDSQGKNKQKNKNCAAIFQNLWKGNKQKVEMK